MRRGNRNHHQGSRISRGRGGSRASRDAYARWNPPQPFELRRNVQIHENANNDEDGDHDNSGILNFSGFAMHDPDIAHIAYYRGSAATEDDDGDDNDHGNDNENDEEENERVQRASMSHFREYGDDEEEYEEEEEDDEDDNNMMLFNEDYPHEDDFGMVQDFLNFHNSHLFQSDMFGFNVEDFIEHAARSRGRENMERFSFKDSSKIGKAPKQPLASMKKINNPHQYLSDKINKIRIGDKEMINSDDYYAYLTTCLDKVGGKSNIELFTGLVCDLLLFHKSLNSFATVDIFIIPNKVNKNKWNSGHQSVRNGKRLHLSSAQASSSSSTITNSYLEDLKKNGFYLPLPFPCSKSHLYYQACKEIESGDTFSKLKYWEIKKSNIEFRNPSFMEYVNDVAKGLLMKSLQDTSQLGNISIKFSKIVGGSGNFIIPMQRPTRDSLGILLVFLPTCEVGGKSQVSLNINDMEIQHNVHPSDVSSRSKMRYASWFGNVPWQMKSLELNSGTLFLVFDFVAKEGTKERILFKNSSSEGSIHESLDQFIPLYKTWANGELDNSQLEFPAVSYS